MKSAKHLISNILNSANYSHLNKQINKHNKLNTLRLLLPLQMQQNLISIYIKNNELFFSFTHPSYCNEFNKYQIKEIKNYLINNKESFKEINMQKLIIKSYVPKIKLDELKQVESNFFDPNKMPSMYYKKHSNATFKNNATNKKLYDSYEKKRELIKKINKTRI